MKIYAQFRFRGKVISMNKDTFNKYLNKAKICNCNKDNCLACRVKMYNDENTNGYK